MKSHRRLVLSPLAGGTLALIIGASLLFGAIDDVVVVEVGPQVITAREIIDASERIYIEQPSGDELADRKRLLEPMIHAKLLVAEAEALGLETRNMRRNLLKFENDYLVNALEDTDIREMIVIDPDEIEQIVELQQVFVHTRHIMVEDEATGLRIMDELRAGADFASLAAEYSLDAGSKDTGGVLPPLSWGMEETSFMTVAYALEPGHVGGPVQTKQGWHVVVQDSVTSREIDVEQAREQAEESLRKGAFNRGQLAYLERMKQELHYAVNDSVVSVFIEHMSIWKQQGFPDMTGEPGSLDRFGFTAEMYPLPVFTYDGGEFTIADFSLYMEGTADPVAGARTTMSRVYRDCEQYFRHFAYADVARQRGYLEATGFDREVKRQREKALIGEIEQLRVALPEPPDEATLERYYDEHREEFRQPAHVVVTEVSIADAAGADHLLGDLRAGTPLEEALTHTHGDPEDPTRVASDVIIDDGSPDWALLDTREVGAVAEVGPADDGKRRLVVIEQVEAARQQEYVEAKGRVIDAVANQLHQQRYMKLIAELKAKYPVVIHDEELLALPL